MQIYKLTLEQALAHRKVATNKQLIERLDLHIAHLQKRNRIANKTRITETLARLKSS